MDYICFTLLFLIIVKLFLNFIIIFKQLNIKIMQQDEIQNPNPLIFKKQCIDEQILYKRQQKEMDTQEIDEIDNYESTFN